MKTTGNTILITGGATGIGLALTKVFSREGNRVIICGRRKEKLLLAQGKFPKIQFKAPIQLSALFLPYLMKQAQAAIVNVSSGLGFIPLTLVPVYCATKAGIHSFSWSLRHQLRNTKVKVFEVIPPTVDTDLDRGARGRRRQEYRGIPPSDVAEATLAGLAKDEYEIAVGQAQGLRTGTPQEAEQIFRRMNGNW
jgi:uncharacterized oxidoreductase